MLKRISIYFVLCIAASTSTAQETRWIGSWGVSPEPPRLQAAGPIQPTRSFENETIRQFVRLSAGGDAVRLRLTNRFGAAPVDVGAVTISRVDSSGAVRSETIVPVRFGGARSATMAAGAPLVSDPIEMPVADLETVSIAIYFPDDTGPCTCHNVGLQTAQISSPGDFTGSEFQAAETFQSRAFLAGVDVLANEPAETIVLLGDSITDGVGSTLDRNRRWPDRFAERLAALDDGMSHGVVNAGISGNRVLSDGAGVSALARFDEDVLAVPGVRHVVVFEGVNDLGIAFGQFEGRLAAVFAMPRTEVTVDTMIAGFRQLIERAHTHGVRIIGATIAPYEGASYFSPKGDDVRRAINDWIRESGEFDAVLDFDAVLRDAAKPSQISDGLHAGDFLHGSDTGYRRVADSIDLGIFEK